MINGYLLQSRYKWMNVPKIFCAHLKLLTMTGNQFCKSKSRIQLCSNSLCWGRKMILKAMNMMDFGAVNIVLRWLWCVVWIRALINLLTSNIGLPVIITWGKDGGCNWSVTIYLPVTQRHWYPPTVLSQVAWSPQYDATLSVYLMSEHSLMSWHFLSAPWPTHCSPDWQSSLLWQPSTPSPHRSLGTQRLRQHLSELLYP